MQVTYDDDDYHHHHNHHRNHPLSLLRSSLSSFQKSASISEQMLLIYFSAKTCSTIVIIFITFMHSTYCYLPQTNIVSWVYDVAAILWLQNLVPVIIITIIIV
jgi:hypothetical protein